MDVLKLKFFRYHLFTSLIVVISLSMLCQFYWFPAPLLMIDGTWLALLILAIVDIIIGPLLTLLLVSSKKSRRELLLDMFIILTIQISALSYGLIKIEQERIWAITHIDGVFVLVPKKEVSQQYLNTKQALPQYKGMYYAMVLNSEIGLHSTISTIPLMYSPERYHALKLRNILAMAIAYNQVPSKVKERYNENHIFKILIGKKSDALVILNKNLVIIDILLLENGQVPLPFLTNKNEVDK